MPAFNVCLIKELTDWINNNLENDLSLEDVTRRSGYSKGYLLRVFKKNKGVTLGYYIRSQRLLRTADELRLTRYPVINIVRRYKFKTQQNFTQRFKAYFGITPAAYRYMTSRKYTEIEVVRTTGHNSCSDIIYSEVIKL